MKILITGATGFVGVKLVRALLREGHSINVLSRDERKAREIFPEKNVTAFGWPDHEQTPPAESLAGINGIIHLMGENLASKRWTEEQKTLLHSTRINSLHSLSRAILENKIDLDFIISASAIGIYPANKSETMTENSPYGNGFLARLCQDWEKALYEVPNVKRKVAIRTGVVFDRGGGALEKMLTPFKLGLGGPIGEGDQMMSWIHRDDLVAIYVMAVNNSQIEGAINAVAPQSVDNFTFTKTLGKVLHRPTIFPVPATALKLMFGEMSGVILDSQKVAPSRLQQEGFHFRHPDIKDCLHSIFPDGHA